MKLDHSILLELIELAHFRGKMEARPKGGRKRWKNWEPAGWSPRENIALRSAAQQLSGGPGTVLCTTPGGSPRLSPSGNRELITTEGNVALM